MSLIVPRKWFAMLMPASFPAIPKIEQPVVTKNWKLELLSRPEIRDQRSAILIFAACTVVKVGIIDGRNPCL